MNGDKYGSLTDILKLGLENQDKLADLNSLVTERVKSADYSRVHGMIAEMISIAEDTDVKDSAEREKRLNELCSEFTDIRIELLKEAEMLQALRATNDHYISLLEDDIREADTYLDETNIDPSLPDAYSKHDMMQKRSQELSVTKNVAISFSEQIRLSAAPLVSLSERILSLQMNLIPLLRGRLTAEKSRYMAAELRKLIAVTQPS